MKGMRYILKGLLDNEDQDGLMDFKFGLQLCCVVPHYCTYISDYKSDCSAWLMFSDPSTLQGTFRTAMQVVQTRGTFYYHGYTQNQ